MQSEQLPHQDHLVRGLTHRMNNILTLFHGYVGLLLDKEGLDRTTRDSLNKIREGACAASELMDRTHSLVRPSAIVWREIELDEFIPLLRNSFENCRGAATKLEIDVSEDVPPIRADLARLKTAVVELVRNACEATQGGGTVRVEVRIETAACHFSSETSNATHPVVYVAINVIDDGPGIASSVNEKIFQPFFSTKRKKNASGLGLNVAAGCVEQIGGLLRHDSREGCTRFQILLPAIS